jgi:hypothetical protein
MRRELNAKRLLALLMATVTMMMMVGPAAAVDINSIAIDASGTGKITTLSIDQDAGGLLGNTVTNLDSSAALLVRGGWDTISITQSGAGNVLQGAFKATAGSTTSSLIASYSGGNTHTLSIGQTTAPANPQVTIDVTNNGLGTTPNTISDTLDGSALTYTLTLLGTDNSLTNSVSATGDITLNQTITGDSNTVSNSVSNATSFTQALSVVGSNNIVTNTSDGIGDKTINVSLASNGNTVSNDFTGGTGTQFSDLTANAGSVLDFALVATGNNTSATLALNNVVGAGGIPAVVRVNQTGDSTTANVTVNGGIYSLGTSLAGGAGILINQASTGATANVLTTALANGYTVYVSQ